jgi:hypothetical protein
MLSSFKNSKEFKEHCFTLSGNSGGKVKVSQLQHMYVTSNGFPTVISYCEYLDSVLNRSLEISYDIDAKTIDILSGEDTRSLCVHSEQISLIRVMNTHLSWSGHWFYNEIAKVAKNYLLSLSEETVVSYLMDDIHFDGDLSNHFCNDIKRISNDPKMDRLRELFSYRYSLIFQNIEQDCINDNEVKRDFFARTVLVDDLILFLLEMLFKDIFNEIKGVEKVLLTNYIDSIDTAIHDMKYNFIFNHLDSNVTFNLEIRNK